MSASEFDRFAEEYERLHAQSIAASGEKPEFFHEYKVKVLRQMAEARGLEPESILDFGSGVGNSVPFLRRYFPEARLVGADISQHSLEVAAVRFPGAAMGLRIEGEQIPAEDGAFAVVFSACVFHHIAAGQHLHWLRELHRVTRPGGMLAVFEHNPWNPLTVRAVRRCPFDDGAQLIKVGDLVKNCRQSGWSDAKTQYHVFFPHALAGLRRLEPWLARVPLGAQYSLVARRGD